MSDAALVEGPLVTRQPYPGSLTEGLSWVGENTPGGSHQAGISMEGGREDDG